MISTGQAYAQLRSHFKFFLSKIFLKWLLAGCNGAGKTTAAFALLTGLLGCRK